MFLTDIKKKRETNVNKHHKISECTVNDID